MSKKGNINVKNIYALSPMQEGMLFHSLMDKQSTAYVEQVVVTLRGSIDPGLFEKTLQQLMQRYDILRTVFVYKTTKQPRQVVLTKQDATVYFESISHFNRERKDTYLETFTRKDREQGFDLTKGPLLRFSLFELEEKLYKLVWSYHHILMDGWCLGILLKDFLQIYQALKTNEPLQMEPVTPYSRYLQWLEKQDKQKGLNYWQRYLGGYEPQSSFPVLKRTPGNDSYRQGEYTFEFKQSLTGKLAVAAADYGVTLNTLVQTLWGILLQRYIDSDDVVFAAVVSGRFPGIEGIETMVGLFINTVPVRMQTHPRQRLSQLFEDVHQQSVLSKSFEYLPLAEIQSNWRPGGELIDHIMVFENYHLQETVKDTGKAGNFGAAIEDTEMHEQTNYDLNIVVMPGNQLLLEFIFNRLTCDPGFIQRLALHFNEIALQAADNPEKEIETIDMLTTEEKRQILFDFNETAAPFPTDKTIHQLFEEQAGKSPDSIAVVGADLRVRPEPREQVQITFRELNKETDQLAFSLREKGIEPGSIVGLIVDRSIEMIVGILGILKAGCAYLPISPNYPEERKQYILEDSNAKILVTGVGNRLACSENLNCQLSIVDYQLSMDPVISPFHHSSFITHHSGNLAYVIFTSGSTGNPKGVPVSHSNISPLLHWGYSHLGIGTGHRTVQNLSYFFDWSVWEIFITLTTGAALYMIPGDIVPNPEAQVDFIGKNGITVLHVTPTQWHYLVSIGKTIETLKYLFIGAEKLTVDLVKRSLDKVTGECRLFNMYGPTEAAIISAVLEIDKTKVDRYSRLPGVPIGKPVGNTFLLVLDRNLNLCPIDGKGELYIAGEGVAAGYLNNPELTAEKFLYGPRITRINTKIEKRTGKFLFLLSPFTFHLSPIYKTGDRVRWLPDGTVEFLGRVDQQMKIRGFRIEPGEIERQILKHKKIKEALVMARLDEAGEKYLCAYVVPNSLPASQSLDSSGNFLISGLREYLSLHLPAYMVPAHFIILEKCL